MHSQEKDLSNACFLCITEIFFSLWMQKSLGIVYLAYLLL